MCVYIYIRYIYMVYIYIRYIYIYYIILYFQWYTSQIACMYIHLYRVYMGVSENGLWPFTGK